MKNKLKLIIPMLLVMVVCVFGIAYAFFEYYRVGNNHQLIVGNIYLNLDDGTDTLSAINVFPEPVAEARARTDNLLTFTISGVNTTTDNDVWYEIRLNEGDGVEGRTRANVEHLVFDLIEINENNEEVLLLDAVTYDVLNDTKIWVDSVERNTTTELKRTYKLRMWLSEDVFISDTNPNADYTTGAFRTSFASVKISVYGDFIEKEMPSYLARAQSTFWPTEINAQISNISEVYFVSLPQGEINSRYNVATVKADVSGNQDGSIKAWLELDENDSTKYNMYVASIGTTYFPSNVTSMFKGFSSVSKFVFDNIDTNIVENMSGMFNGCSNLNAVDLSIFDLSNTIYLSGMFGGCSNLVELDLSMWNTSKITNAGSMFYGCSKLVSVNLSNWNLTGLSSAYGLGGMFGGCSSLTSLSIDNWILNNTINFISIISGSGITSLELTNFDLSASSSTNGMFQGCSNITNLIIKNWNTKNVVTMSSMFQACSGLIELDLSAFDTSNAIATSAMFAGCTNLLNLNINSFIFDNVTSSGSMFNSMPDSANITVGGTAQQDWILALASPDNRPAAWTTENVVVG